MTVQTAIVGAVLLYAVVYLTRYAFRVLNGKSTGCGCGDGAACKQKKTGES